MKALEARGLVSCAGQNDHVGTYWDITTRGARVVLAGLGEDLSQKMTDLLQGEYDLSKARSVAAWLKANFRFGSPKTPPGQKALKKDIDALHWYMAHGEATYRASIESTWAKIQPHLADLVRYFTDEGGFVVPSKIQVGANTYLNQAGLNEQALNTYIKRLEPIFQSISGWRQKALTGGLKIVLASPKDFSGTAGGKYKDSEDALYVRTTPAVLKRGEGYASFEYILVHEMGHRFERKNHLPTDFDRVEWYSTRYSYKEGEAFAELFALGHFGIRGTWDPKVERFEKVMTGHPVEARPGLPEHLRKFIYPEATS
jgi:hypothetical protein